MFLYTQNKISLLKLREKFIVMNTIELKKELNIHDSARVSRLDADVKPSIKR